jgi:hypothetical protein
MRSFVRRLRDPRTGMTYTDADWSAEYLALFAKSLAPPPCPSCGRTGFYGPRRADDDRRYRLCKFCGFYQGSATSLPNAVRQFTGAQAGRWLEGRPTSGGFSSQRLNTAAPIVGPLSKWSPSQRPGQSMTPRILGGRFRSALALTRPRPSGANRGTPVSTCSSRHGAA